MKPPGRAEVWLVDLGYVAKTRPCVVISILPSDQDRALVTIVPHTTSVRGTQYEVAAQVRFLKSGAFDCQDLQPVALAKCIRKLGVLTAAQFAPIEDRVRVWLAL